MVNKTRKLKFLFLYPLIVKQLLQMRKGSQFSHFYSNATEARL